MSKPSMFQGHDCCPFQFSYKGPGSLKFVKKLDIPKQTSRGSMSAMQHFRNLDKKATDDESNELGCLHQNSITQLCMVSGTKTHVDKYSSVGLDGAMVLWDFKVLPTYTTYTKVYGHPVKLVDLAISAIPIADRCIQFSRKPCNLHTQTLSVEWPY
uniref:Zgc:86896 n=1 Tax=Hucho hucho TaxID=62062 RepID=A0A4W5KFU2_9TELE